MSLSEKFSLRWNDFQQNVSQTFGKLRNEVELCDVTLVSDDNKQISAHKVVLSACSEFFKNIFKKNIHSHPLIYLDNVTSSELKLILDYIYLGEVQIFQDDLDSFLHKAQKLKLEGLQAVENEILNPSFIEEDESKEMLHHPGEDNILTSNEKIQNSKKRKSCSVKNEDKVYPVQKSAIEVENNSEVESKFHELVETEDGVYKCTVCAKTMTHRFSMRRHIETHMSGLSYNCNFCDKTFRSSRSYDRHRNNIECHE